MNKFQGWVDMDRGKDAVIAAMLVVGYTIHIPFRLSDMAFERVANHYPDINERVVGAIDRRGTQVIDTMERRAESVLEQVDKILTMDVDDVLDELQDRSRVVDGAFKVINKLLEKV